MVIQVVGAIIWNKPDTKGFHFRYFLLSAPEAYSMSYKRYSNHILLCAFCILPTLATGEMSTSSFNGM